MIRVGVVGAAGKMGDAVSRLVVQEPDMELVAAIERADYPELGKQFGNCRLACSLPLVLDTADVVCDFAVLAGLGDRAAACAESGKAYVCGVTGLSEQTHDALRKAGEQVPVVYAPNFSVGVNVLYKLAIVAAGLLGPGYDIEIVETHHRQKRDAPSGTARKLADMLKKAAGATSVVHGRSGDVGPRPPKEIAVHSIRAGDVVGDHTVIFGGIGERLELTHRASGREAFASGVLRAIRFAATAGPGFYSMADVLAGRVG